MGFLLQLVETSRDMTIIYVTGAGDKTGKPCRESCDKHGYDYYWCYTNVKNSAHPFRTWDYCSKCKENRYGKLTTLFPKRNFNFQILLW